MNPITAESLVGEWQLAGWEIEYPQRGTRTRPFGDAPRGLLIYTASGWMSATMKRPDRRPFGSADMRRVTDAAKAAAFDGYLHYAGRWRLEGERVLHEVHAAMNPLLEGTVQARQARFDGETLVLEAHERLEPSGEPRVHRIAWRRAG